MNIIPKAEFYFIPDLINSRFDLNVKLDMKIRLWRMVIESLRAIIKKPVRDLINELRKI